jgi:hypothetical protein
MYQPNSTSTQNLTSDLKLIKLTPQSNTASVRAWLSAWHATHLVTLPPSMLDELFWDGRHISETSARLLEENLGHMMDCYPARAVVADLCKELGRRPYFVSEA